MTAALSLLAAFLAAPLDPPTAERDTDKRVRELAQLVVDKAADPAERRMAALELAGLGEKARLAIPALVRALRDPDGPVQSSAATALGLVGKGDRRAITGLVRALGDPDRLVRYEATMSLTFLAPAGPATAAALGAVLLDRLYDEYLSSVGFLAKGLLVPLVTGYVDVEGSGGWGDLYTLQALGDSVRGRRLWAAFKLAELGPAARPALPALRLAAEDGDPVVRRAAVEALKKVEGQGTQR